MSPNGKPGRYVAPGKAPRYTLDEYAEVIKHFKTWFEDHNLDKWIMAAGIGAILEGLHILWLAGLWLQGRIH